MAAGVALIEISENMHIALGQEDVVISDLCMRPNTIVTCNYSPLPPPTPKLSSPTVAINL